MWHGGVAIFARAYFHVYDMNRKANVKLHRDQDEHKINMVQHGGPGLIVTLTLQVFACDSFDGFPDDDRTAVTKSSYFEVRSLEQKPTPRCT